MDKIKQEVLKVSVEINQLDKKALELDKKVNELYGVKNILKDEFYYLLTSYDVNTIVDLLDICDETKKDITENIEEVQIYTEWKIDCGILNIKYCYKANNYHYVVNNRMIDIDYNIVIFKNSERHKTYDIVKEFIGLNYNYLENEKFLDNYVKLFVKDNPLKLGMIILAYYYLIEFSDLDEVDPDVLSRKNIKKIMSILDRDFKEFIDLKITKSDVNNEH